MIVAIHQPDFMPWMGFFDKIAKADLWVVLDHVGNNPRHMGYWNRVAILVAGKAFWLSISVDKKTVNGRISIPINQMVIKECEQMVLTKIMRTFEQSYKKTAFYDSVLPLFESYIFSKEALLYKRNIEFVSEVFKLLDMDTPFIYSSDLNVSSKSTSMLVDIMEKVGGDVYLFGDGSDGYQDNNHFHENGIQTIKNNFTHPNYLQRSKGQFIAGLSIIDAIANIGPLAVTELLKSK